MLQEIFYFIKEYSPTAVHGKRFYENKKYKYELDIFLPDYNLGIEFDGVAMHSEIHGNKDKFYHLNKDNFFKKLGQVNSLWNFSFFNNKNFKKK